MSFPQDDYTPFGYLHTPGHTRNLTPRGAARGRGRVGRLSGAGPCAR